MNQYFNHVIPLFAAAVLAVCATRMTPAASAPGPEALKQALDKRLQSLRPDGTSERNVLFQALVAGKPDGGSYPFRVTLIIRDYGSGYPKNRYYGETCVAHMNEVIYTLSPDAFGGWDVQGRMTPLLSEKECKPNPAAGVSSIPLAGLSGSPAISGAASAATVAATPVSAAAGSANGVATGAYDCWANGEARMLMNFTVRGNGQYTGSDGKAGSFTFDPSTTRVAFKGGALDGAMPEGFQVLYISVQGRSTFSFRSPRGAEAAFCQKR